MTEALGYRPGLDQPELDWQGAVPVATRFDDPYYSLENGLAEADYVFLDGNGLPGRLSDGFHIAELGFGTGLNMLATARTWKGPGRIRFTSFEAHPLEAAQIARALAAFPELDPAPFLTAWSEGARQIALEGLDLEVIQGPAAETLPHWRGAADAWYLDGFAPAKNPALWTPELLAQVHAHTRPGGTAATYTAAGAVRRALETAGFQVTRRPGFGRKRHMTQAVRPR